MGKAYAFAGNATVGDMVAARLGEAGYTRVEDAGSAGVVVTYCTSQTALEDAYFDEGGFVQAARPGTVLVDLSPSTPTFARELNAVATVNDLAVVEAPLVVVDPCAADAFGDKANLVCLAGGDEAHIAQAMPLLRALAGDVRDIGGPGAAQLARASYTLQAVAQLIAAAEADALYRAVRRSAGMAEVESMRAGATTPLADCMLAAVCAERFAGGYTVEMLMAELAAALQAADDADLILPQAEACLHLLELLAVIGGAEKAPSALSLVYRDEAACASAGLDWTRAEQAYGREYGDDGFDDDGYGDDDGCGCGHSHGDGYPGYGDYPGYSPN